MICCCYCYCFPKFPLGFKINVFNVPMYSNVMLSVCLRIMLERYWLLVNIIYSSFLHIVSCTGSLSVGIPVPEGLPRRLCGGQTSLLSHRGAPVWNRYRHLRRTELSSAQYRKDRKRIFKQLEKRTQVIIAECDSCLYHRRHKTRRQLLQLLSGQ